MSRSQLCRWRDTLKLFIDIREILAIYVVFYGHGMFFTSSFSFVGVTIVSKDAEALSRRQAPLVCLRLVCHAPLPSTS